MLNLVLGVGVFSQKRCGDPNPQYFSKSTAVQMGGVLPYKWGAYCRTNGRRTAVTNGRRIAGFPFLLQSLEARKVRRYTWGAYCRTILEVYCRTFETSCRGRGFRKIAHFPFFHPPFLVHPFFLFSALFAPPFPGQFSSPKSPLSGSSDLLFLVEKRQPAGAGVLGTVLDGVAPQEKKENPFFWRAKKGESKCQEKISRQHFCTPCRDESALKGSAGT